MARCYTEFAAPDRLQSARAFTIWAAMDMLNSLQSNGWALLAILALLVAVIASVMDWRRAQRRDIDAVGFMPWPAITVLASVITLFAGALAMTG